jgi:hypothetical protein
MKAPAKYTDEHIAGARLQFTSERWTAEATLAWDSAMNRGDLPCAVAMRERPSRELERRDVDNWLRLDSELIEMQEKCGASRLQAERTRLALHPAEHHALGVQTAALAC